MSRLNLGYRIAPRTNLCAHTGRTLTPGEEYVATLVELPGAEDLGRRDYAIEAWEAGVRPAGMFGSWRSVVPSPDAKQRLVIDDALILDLFEQLQPSDDRRAALRFVLALLLVRRRVLALEGSRRGDHGRAEMVVRFRGERSAEGHIGVVDPGLDEKGIEAVIQQFEAVIGGTAGEEA